MEPPRTREPFADAGGWRPIDTLSADPWGFTFVSRWAGLAQGKAWAEEADQMSEGAWDWTARAAIDHGLRRSQPGASPREVPADLKRPLRWLTASCAGNPSRLGLTFLGDSFFDHARTLADCGAGSQWFGGADLDAASRALQMATETADSPEALAIYAKACGRDAALAILSTEAWDRKRESRWSVWFAMLQRGRARMCEAALDMGHAPDWDHDKDYGIPTRCAGLLCRRGPLEAALNWIQRGSLLGNQRAHWETIWSRADCGAGAAPPAALESHLRAIEEADAHRRAKLPSDRAVVDLIGGLRSLAEAAHLGASVRAAPRAPAQTRPGL